jgi:hypothetical protein
MEGAYRLKGSLQVAGCIPAGRGVEGAWEGDYKQGKFFITNQVLMRGKFTRRTTKYVHFLLVFFHQQRNTMSMGFEVFDVFRIRPDIRALDPFCVDSA